MDKDAKSFFEKLSGVGRVVNEDDEEEEVKTRILEEEADDATATDEEEEEGEGESPLADFFEDAEGQLTVDVYETPTHFVVKSAVAGVDDQNLDIALTNEAITIRGSRKEEDRAKDQKYHVQECYWGRFARSIILPQEIDPDKAQASLKNGILKISLPKVNKQKTKKLKVKFE